MVILSSFCVMVFSFIPIGNGIVKLLISLAISAAYTCTYIWIKSSLKNEFLQEWDNGIVIIHIPLYLTGLTLFHLSFSGRQLNEFINIIVVILVLALIFYEFHFFSLKKIILSIINDLMEIIKIRKNMLLFLTIFLAAALFFLNIFLSFRDAGFTGNEIPGNTGRPVGSSKLAEEGKDASGIFLYGPYLSVPYGIYRIELEYDSTQRLNWDIAYENGTEVLAGGALNTGKDKIMKIDFPVRKKIRDLEFRLYYGGKGNVTVHKIVFKKSPPAGSLPAFIYLFILIPLLFSILIYLAGKHIITSVLKNIKKDRSADALGNRFDYFSGVIAIFTSIVLFAIILILFNDYGISWDEYGQNAYGKYIVKFFSSLFKNRGAFEFTNQFYYGGFYETAAVLFSSIFSFLGEYEARHLINALTGLAGIIFAVKIAKLLEGGAGGLIVLLLLATYPSYFGHMFMNSKDIPFAAAFLASVYFILKNFNKYPDIAGKDIFYLGSSIGITAGIRSGGLVLFVILAFSLLIRAIYIFIDERKQGTGQLKRNYARLAAYFLSVFIIGYFFMLVLWPFGAQNPLINPIVSLSKFSNFMGESKDVWKYLSEYLLWKLPELTVILLGAGIILAGVLIFRKNVFSFKKTPSIIILVFSLLFPLFYMIYQQSTLYNEIRQVIFIQCLFIILSGLVFSFFIRKLAAWNSTVFWAAGLIFCSFIFLQIINMIKLHPYQYIHYNYFAQGLKGAEEKGLPFDYWVIGYKETGEDFLKYLEKRDGDDFIKNVYNLSVLGAPLPIYYYLKPNIHVSTITNGHEDFCVDYPFSSNIVLQVQREGVVLHTLYEK